jgi:hypothetical protein
MTRGRGANHAYVILDDVGPDHDCAAGSPGAPERLSARDALAEVLRRPEADAAAHTVLRDGMAARAAAQSPAETATEPQPDRRRPSRWGRAPEAGAERETSAGAERESAVAAALRQRQEQERAPQRAGRDVGWGR